MKGNGKERNGMEDKLIEGVGDTVAKETWRGDDI